MLTERRAFTAFLRTFPWGQYLCCLGPSLLVLLFVALFMGTGRDLAELFRAMRRDQQLEHAIMLFVSNIVPPISYALYAGFLWRGIRKADYSLVRLALAYFIVQALISFLFVRMLKITVGKPRPMAMLAGEDYEHFSLTSGNHSFPSGHSSEIMGSIVPLAARWKRYALSLGLGLLAALVVYSRLYLSRHHLSDIAAGLMLGSVSGILIQYISTRGNYERHKKRFPGQRLYRSFQQRFFNKRLNG